MKFKVGQIPKPDQRGQISDNTIIHKAIIAFTPDAGGFHPRGR